MGRHPLVLGFVLLAAQAAAQGTPATPPNMRPDAPRPDASRPEGARADPRRSEIDNLLTALKAAPSEEAAAALEARIKQLWISGGSPAAALLMQRGLRDLQNNADADAVADFDAVLALEPEMAAAFERRGVARFASGDFVGALGDIQAALAREPRHFGAWQSMSRMAEGTGDFKGALLAWKRALELNPKTPEGEKRLRELDRKVNGEAT